ncbi:hypothetical protein ABZ128_25430 [Streptomyces sp. NPDC006326]|uniref:AMIN-like domain-containing (lipo)protein n=1 Tax=Streptomyces sp. NPDC006326 TaxID=3156752 RepID=UPI0033A33088
MNHPHRRRVVALATGALLTAGTALAAPASTATATATADAQRTPLVVNARWGGHCTYDRIVVDLRGHVPQVEVTRVPKLVQDGSGKPVPLPGTHFLQIRLHPAQAHDRSGQSVYHGPKLARIRLPKLQGLAMTGDFEGYVTFGAGFRGKPAFRSFTLHAPERFVLDVAHRNTCG